MQKKIKSQSKSQHNSASQQDPVQQQPLPQPNQTIRSDISSTASRISSTSQVLVIAILVVFLVSIVFVAMINLGMMPYLMKTILQSIWTVIVGTGTFTGVLIGIAGFLGLNPKDLVQNIKNWSRRMIVRVTIISLTIAVVITALVGIPLLLPSQSGEASSGCQAKGDGTDLE